MNAFSRLILTALLVGLTCLVGCASSSPTRAADEVADSDRDCGGPKKRVAVLRFGGIGKYGAYEGWDVGEALAAQVATALEQTGCLIVADRMALSEVLREQELGLASITARSSSPQAGRLLGAQVLVKGDITEFELGNKGRGITAGFGFDDIPLGLRIGGNRGKAHIAMDIRLIDASTGEVLATERLTSKATNYGIALGVDYTSGSISTDQFGKTPLGKAVRKSAGEAAGFVMASLRDVNWRGQIVDALGDQVFMNAGADAGVEVGDTFTVKAVAKELVDPASGIVLGTIEQSMGEVLVESVTPTYAVARMVGNFPIRRGDLLQQ